MRGMNSNLDLNEWQKLNDPRDMPFPYKGKLAVSWLVSVRPVVPGWCSVIPAVQEHEQRLSFWTANRVAGSPDDPQL